MKIICVCGLGMGSSLILKMSVEKAMSELGVPCDVEHSAAGTMAGIKADLVVASEDFRAELGSGGNAVFVKNVVKVPEIKENLKSYLEAKKLI
jgi:PTS system ascorbate-specific IIB component